MTGPDQTTLGAQSVLEEALSKFDEVELRADQHVSPLAVFVDAGLLSKLVGPNWQPLFGIPGSGKTIHLKALYERLVDDYEETSILPVYINLRDCVADVPQIEDERKRALECYRAFLGCLPRALRESCRKLDHNRMWDALLREVFPNRGDDERAIKQLAHLIREVQAIRNYSEIVFEETSSAEREREAGVSFDATAAAAGGSRVGARMRRRGTRRSRAGLDAKGTARPVLAFQEIRDVFESLAEARNVNRIGLLIDEWPALDPSAQTAVQPAFGELLRRTFGSSPRVTVKIATNRRQTRFFDSSTGEGLRKRQDIFRDVSLDGRVLPEAKLVEFFERVLQKHLEWVHEPLRDVFATKRLGAPRPPALVDMLFASRSAFKRLVLGTDGSPRQLLYTIGTLVDRHGSSLDRKWTLNDVYGALGLEADDSAPRPSQALLAGEAITAADVLMDQSIQPVIARNGSRLFLVAVADIPQLGPLLAELETRRVISRATRYSRSRVVRERYIGYAVSTATWEQMDRLIRFVRGGTAAIEPTFAQVDRVMEASEYVISAKPLADAGWLTDG